MHILHLQDRLSVRGGADIHLLAIMARQREQHRVTLAVGRVERDAQPPPGVELRLVPGLGGRVREAPAACRGLLELVAHLHPDLIHLHNVLQPRVMEAAARSAPAVVTVQDHRSFCPARGRVLPDGTPCSHPPDAQRCSGCFDDPDYAERIRAITHQRAAALRRFARVVVLSHYMAAQLRMVGVPGPRTQVIPPFPWSPAEPAGPEPTLPAGPVALAAGRLVWAKGFHLLLESWARVRPPLPLVIAGDGPARSELELQASRLGLGPDRLRFTGWLPRPNVEALLLHARLALMPSLWAEPFGIWGLEAQARGVPVVAFDVGGISDWLRPNHGWLLPPADGTALAQACLDASDAREARRRGLLATRFTRDQFDPTTLMEQLDLCYQQTLASGPLQG